MWSLDPLTAGITAAIGAGLIYIAWSQLSAMHNTSKATLLAELDSRWSTYPMTEVRRKANELIQTVETTHKDEPPEQRKLSEPADFTGRLTKMRRDAASDYLSLMEICSFFETVGYASKKKYVKFEDIYELYGGSILTAGILFDAYLQSQRRELHEQGRKIEAAKHYEYFSWLLNETRKRVTQTKIAESN